MEKLLNEKKENTTENVGKKETYTESIKRNIFTILIIFILTRYKRSTEVIITKSKKENNCQNSEIIHNNDIIISYIL